MTIQQQVEQSLQRGHTGLRRGHPLAGRSLVGGPVRRAGSLRTGRCPTLTTPMPGSSSRPRPSASHRERCDPPPVEDSFSCALGG